MEEVAFGYPFRELNNEQFNFTQKKKFNKKAHRAGSFGVLCLLATVGFAEGCYTQGTDGHRFLVGALTSAACGFVYWLVFDIGYSLGIGKGPFYLGQPKGNEGLYYSDNAVVRFFGKNAGVKKAVFCVVVIIGLNLIQTKFF